MKKVIITFTVFLFSSYFLFAKDGYSIKVKINGIKDTVCHLANYYGDKQYYKDTARVDKNGNMIFDGKQKLPGGIYMVILPVKKYFV